MVRYLKVPAGLDERHGKSPQFLSANGEGALKKSRFHLADSDRFVMELWWSTWSQLWSNITVLIRYLWLLPLPPPRPIQGSCSGSSSS